MNNIEMLKKLSLFSELAEGDLEQIDGISFERCYKKSSIIFLEGEPGDSLYYVKHGKVKIFRTYEDGREHIIHILGQGDVFGEATLFNTIAYPASASVYEDSVIGVIKNAQLENLIIQNSELALKIIKILAAKLLFAQNKIRDLTFHDVFTRTATQILKLSADHGRKTDQGILVDVQLSRQDLADMVGTTRETISRVISKFKKEKAVTEANDKIIITNQKKLKNWL